MGKGEAVVYDWRTIELKSEQLNFQKDKQTNIPTKKVILGHKGFFRNKIDIIQFKNLD